LSTGSFGKSNPGFARVVLSITFLILVVVSNHDALGAIRNNGGARIYKEQSAIDPNKLALQGVVMVKFKPGVPATMQEMLNVPELQRQILKEANPTSMKPMLQLLRVRLDKSSEVLNNIYLVHYTGTVTPALVAQSLSKNTDVQYAEPHYIYKVDDVNFTPNDSLLSQQYALTNIQAFQAWNITQGDSTVAIGIVDTGVDWMHPDLYGNIWHNPHWTTDTQFPADSIGWDFGGTNGTPDNNPEEDSPHHGTHVAGIAAAIANNKIGIAGVAPGCKIMAVKVSRADMSDPQTGEPYIVYGFEGIIYAADNGARVINCSWGGVGYSQYEQDVINYATQKGALVVAAAGNDHSDEFQTPAYYDNVLSVAATDSNDKSTYFTNYSYNVSVSAPGLDIVSTWGTDSYTTLSGTSMASPCAAGVAALVVSQHPEYTPQQVLEQVRVSSDNMDNLNPAYAQMLGFGRVNAYRALTVSSPAVIVSDIVMSDSIGGNNDGIFTDGETIQVFGMATDWLNPTSNLQLTLTSSDPYVTIAHGNVAIGSLQTLESYDLKNNPLSFKVNNGVPAGHLASFVIKITDGSYSDYKMFTVLLKPLFNQLKLNNIATTITAKGNIGFNDYPNNSQGIGFIYQPDGDSLLFEGAFMAGTSASTVVDVARDSTQNASEEDNDFRPVGLVGVQTPGQVADQEGITTFTDSNATANRIGIEVTLHTYSYNRDSTSNFVILQYKIQNLNAFPINNFYGGLFFDWDIGPNGANNIASYNSQYQLGYAYNTTRSPKTYTGCALIYGANVNYTAIDNADSLNGIYGGFTKLHKWKALSSGTVNSHAGPSDISIVVSGGPVSIAANSDATLTFVLTAGDTLQDLERAVAVAKEIYGKSTGIINPPPIPTLAELYQNYPNPFNPSTVISFVLKQQAKVTVDVYNVIGEKVETITDKAYPMGGPYNLPFSSNGLASGVYFVRLTAASSNQTYLQIRKMMILK